jgi:hypothetical protein
MHAKWLVVVALAPNVARAQPLQADAEPSPPPPPPGEESGRIDGGDRESRWRQIGRGVLFVPRAAFEIASSPIRGGAWAYQRYQLRRRWLDLFFNEDRTVGLYPTLSYDAGYGPGVGARFVARDVLGAHEHFAVRAGTGGTYAVIAQATARSGARFEPFDIELAAEYERRPRDRFYGIGNADETDAAEMIDPLTSDAAVETRYRQAMARASLVVDARLVADLHVLTAGALTTLDFERSDEGAAIDQVYMTERLVGWNGVRHAYADVELLWDSRRSASRWELAPLVSTGWLGSIWGGRVAVEDGPDFWRYGADAQYLIKVADGPRVIATRAHAEAVSGSLHEVPFDELPKLGGRYLLRGYPTDRFRDRVAALASVEYQWDLSKYVVARTFVDGGRVARTVDQLDDGDLRVGYGLGIDIYTERQFVLRGDISSSVDGGVFVHIAFDPAFELDPRVGRR